MRAIRSAVVWPVIALATVVFGVPAIFAALLPPRGDWFLRFARGWARTLLAVAGSFFPSIRAARLKPVTAMHHVG